MSVRHPALPILQELCYHINVSNLKHSRILQQLLQERSKDMVYLLRINLCTLISRVEVKHTNSQAVLGAIIKAIRRIENLGPGSNTQEMLDYKCSADLIIK